MLCLDYKENRLSFISIICSSIFSFLQMLKVISRIYYHSRLPLGSDAGGLHCIKAQLNTVRITFRCGDPNLDVSPILNNKQVGIFARSRSRHVSSTYSNNYGSHHEMYIHIQICIRNPASAEQNLSLIIMRINNREI